MLVSCWCNAACTLCWSMATDSTTSTPSMKTLVAAVELMLSKCEGCASPDGGRVSKHVQWLYGGPVPSMSTKRSYGRQILASRHRLERCHLPSARHAPTNQTRHPETGRHVASVACSVYQVALFRRQFSHEQQSGLNVHGGPTFHDATAASSRQPTRVPPGIVHKTSMPQVQPFLGLRRKSRTIVSLLRHGCPSERYVPKDGRAGTGTRSCTSADSSC